MGYLIYGDSKLVIGFDDRTLAHLQLVISAKMRRGENFFMSWQDSFASGSGRSALWMDRAIPLMFKFSQNTAEPIRREWIEVLNRTADSNGGLQVVAEPPPAA
jgi:hypothetical protein